VRFAAAVLLSWLATVAGANAPDWTARPEARPVVLRAAEIDRAVTAAILGVRSATVPVDQGKRAAGFVSLRRVTGTTPSLSPRPELRPENLRRRNQVVRTGMIPVRPKLTGETQLLCNSADILGEKIAPIAGRISGCGVQDPVRVRSVAGVALSQPSVMDCRTAMSLRFWVESAAKPVFSRKGGLAGLKVASHYSCRTRNNQRGAKISEHGKGRAIDISGFQLGNGETVSVLRGWNDNNGASLRKLHKAACGPFGTVLGPNADRFHRDHFHFDTARYRSGSYCR
jgi:hypothetical protein